MSEVIIIVAVLVVLKFLFWTFWCYARQRRMNNCSNTSQPPRQVIIRQVAIPTPQTHDGAKIIQNEYLPDMTQAPYSQNPPSYGEVTKSAHI